MSDLIKIVMLLSRILFTLSLLLYGLMLVFDEPTSIGRAMGLLCIAAATIIGDTKDRKP